MDTNRIQGSQIVEDRTQQISKKVWDLESRKDRLLGINANGTVPLRIQKTLKENKLVPTDYIDETDGRKYIQKINGVIKSTFIKED